MGLDVLGELQMRSRGTNCRSHTSFLSHVPPSKWDTWFGGSRWWHCGLAQKNCTEHPDDKIGLNEKEVWLTLITRRELKDTGGQLIYCNSNFYIFSGMFCYRGIFRREWFNGPLRLFHTWAERSKASFLNHFITICSVKYINASCNVATLQFGGNSLQLSGNSV